jgi:hypothetical protein
VTYTDLLEATFLLNGSFLAVGYALLATSIRSRSVRTWVSYGGVALLVGAAVVGVVLCGLAVAGLRIDLPAFAVVAALLAAAGFVAAVLHRPAGPSKPTESLRSKTASSSLIATTACAAVAVVSLLLLASAFRSSPTLDDVWNFWLPKGVALSRLGLDHRLFLPNAGYLSFDHLDYPLWWSIVLGLGARLTGSVDLRIVDIELAVLVVAMLAAAARLLTSRIRPAVLWPCLLLVAVAPELHRQVLGGGADLALAVYLSLFVLCAALWLAEGGLFELGLATVFAAAAVQLKTEGAPQLLAFAAVLAVAAWRIGARRQLGLWGAVATAFASALPFLVWRQAHGLRNDISFSHALDPAFLAGRTERVAPAARALGHQLVSPHDWFLLVPAVVLLGVIGALRERRPLWLAPAVLVLVGYAFWIWANWSDTMDLRFRLDTSAHRIVDATVLAAALAHPFLGERLLLRRSGSAPASGQPATRRER